VQLFNCANFFWIFFKKGQDVGCAVVVFRLIDFMEPRSTQATCWFDFQTNWGCCGWSCTWRILHL